MRNALFITFLSLFVGITTANAQSITIEEDYPIGDMMRKYISNNKAQTVLAGYRIQLLATTDRQKVESAKRKFESLYPSMNVDWEHSKPYYKLRAGAYRTRLDAVRALKEFKKDYPGAYTAQARINKSELL